jgi:hypothetical protein
MQYFLVILLIILSQSISAQVVKGGIDPNGPLPQERVPGKILTGGPSLTLVFKLEEKVQRFRTKLQRRKQKCLGSAGGFKNFSEAVTFLNLQQAASTHQTSHSGECSHRGPYRCLLSPRVKKLIRSIESDPVLEHYLLEHEDLSKTEFQDLKRSLKSHLSGHE